MATRQELENALIAADTAGDTQAAQLFANEINALTQPTDFSIPTEKTLRTSSVKEQPITRSYADELKRQLGLTARYLTEGTVGTADFLATPVRALQNAIMPSNLQAQPLSQVLTRNLPQPETMLEKTIAGPSRALVSTGTGMALAGAPIAKGIPFTPTETLTTRLPISPTTQTGKTIQEALISNAPTQASASISGGLGQAVAEQMGGGVIAQTLAGLGSGIVGGMAVRPQSPTKPILSTKENTIKQSINAGYAIPPSQAGGTKWQKFQESIGGKPKTEQEAQFKNQTITNNLVKKYLGLSESDNLGTDAIQAVKELHNPTYEKVSKLPEIKTTTSEKVFDSFGMPKGTQSTTKVILPSGKQLLDDLKQSRADSKGYWDFWKRTGDPATLKQAIKLDSESSLLENKLEQLAKIHKQPELINELKNARRELAKAHTVNKAMNPATGDISANIFSNMLGKVPLTGEAKTIANYAKAFPKIARVPTTGEPTPFTLLDTALAAHGFGSSNVPETVLPLLRYPARWNILREGTQKAIANQQGKPTINQPYVPYGGLLNIDNQGQQ
jgi:hypothetical protein